MTKKHTLIMLACCLIPMAAIALTYVFNLPFNTVLTVALVLLCPISHLLMIKFMHSGHQVGNNEQKARATSIREAVDRSAAHVGH